MTAYVVCLTSSGGIPIFVRKRGEGEAMTFPKVASLNGVRVFLKSQNIVLEDTETVADGSLVWKEFENSITLIAVTGGGGGSGGGVTSTRILEKFLCAVFGAMILVIGADEIKNVVNVERLKRDSRACIPIIDQLLECLDTGDGNCTSCDLIDELRCVPCPENNSLQSCLELFMECLDSAYGCILAHGCTTVATDSWWSLDSLERKLLVTTVMSDLRFSTRDIPVFLPKKSPNVAFRLVSVTLVNGIRAICLCGPSPELARIEKSAARCWRSHLEILRTVQRRCPRDITSFASLDTGILAFLLVNRKMGKFVMSHGSQRPKTRTAGIHGLDILRTFYYQAVENFLMNETLEESASRDRDCANANVIIGKETYWCSEYHKCHAIRENEHILCILYSSGIPTHTMRLITRKTLGALLSDKKMP